MAKTITVAAGPTCAPGQVAIWEINPEHPDGEVFLAAPQAGQEAEAVEVARTPEVSKRLSDGRLVETDEKPKARPAEQASAAGAGESRQHPAAGAGEVIPGVTEVQQRALVAAGYVSVEDIRKASDADLLKVDGVGPATVAAPREATKE
jgi:hypothetical protein